MTLGDARLSLQREPPHSYDLVLLDAFSADSVPTHLLTAEAFRLYLGLLRPDGLLLLHLSNRNLALEPSAAATARAIGAPALVQYFLPARMGGGIAASPTESRADRKLWARDRDFFQRPSLDDSPRYGWSTMERRLYQRLRRPRFANIFALTGLVPATQILIGRYEARQSGEELETKLAHASKPE